MMRRVLIFITIFIFGFLSMATTEAKKDNPARAHDRYSKIMVVSTVVEALGRIGGPKVRGVLVKALKSKEFLVRANAVQALGTIQDKKSIPLLKNLVNDENYLVRVLAAVTLFRLGQKDMEELLFAFLKDDEPTVRATAVGEVGGLGEKFLQALAEMLPTEKEDLVRVRLVEALGNGKFDPALPYIREALDDKNVYVRRAACYALGEFDDRKSIPRILKKLDDEDIVVRVAAKETLSKFGNRSQIRRFWKEAEESGVDFRLQASSYIALANLKEADILPILVKAITAPESPTLIRRKAGSALVILRPYISRLINKALAHSKIKHPENIQLFVQYKIDGKDLFPIFMEALKDKESPLYQDAPIILKKLYSRMALPGLRKALLQDNPDLVAAVAYVLGELEDQDSVELLIKVFKKYEI